MWRLIILVLCFVSTEALAKEKIPYKMPSISIRGWSIQAAQAKAVEICIAANAVIETNTASQVICAKPVQTGFKGILYKALTTPANSTDPRDKLRINFVQQGDTVMFTIDEYIEYQTAFGQVNRNPIENGESSEKMQQALDHFKNKIETGSQTSDLSQQAGTTESSVAFLYADDPEKAARELAASQDCDKDFQLFSQNADKKIYAATCDEHRKILITCEKGSCKTLD